MRRHTLGNERNNRTQKNKIDLIKTYSGNCKLMQERAGRYRYTRVNAQMKLPDYPRRVPTSTSKNFLNVPANAGVYLRLPGTTTSTYQNIFDVPDFFSFYLVRTNAITSNKLFDRTPRRKIFILEMLRAQDFFFLGAVPPQIFTKLN
jgi:hypothetical protein